MEEWKMRPIGYIRSSYTSTDQVPKGLGTTHTMEGILEVLPEFADGLQDTEGFSHLVILWVFHQSQACELVGRVPTDNRVHGVFSTRSPRRPNPIGLTNVELIKRDGARLHLRGIDMLDGTPVLDIKPYTARDRKTRIRTGWLRKKGA